MSSLIRAPSYISGDIYLSPFIEVSQSGSRSPEAGVYPGKCSNCSCWKCELQLTANVLQVLQGATERGRQVP